MDTKPGFQCLIIRKEIPYDESGISRFYPLLSKGHSSTNKLSLFYSVHHWMSNVFWLFIEIYRDNCPVFAEIGGYAHRQKNIASFCIPAADSPELPGLVGSLRNDFADSCVCVFFIKHWIFSPFPAIAKSRFFLCFEYICLRTADAFITCAFRAAGSPFDQTSQQAIP